ncbi:DUF6612 family protein [Pseudogracilibacillus sp. ICA-222130]|uniref:DUF6612 family protein n=1 Tax=Pseudogracilibacillus sp. ICA-222130 TaxID=3134655 RepID=UPI0030BAD2EE
MKKVLLTIFSAMLLIVLSACGNNSNDVNATNNNTNNETETETENVENNEANNNGEEAEEETDNAEGNSDAEELLQKATEANNNLESFSVEADMKQLMVMDGEEMDINSTTSMDIIMNPMTMKQTIVTDIPDAGKQETESYFTKDGYFMLDPESDTWMKLPDEITGQLLAQVEAQANVEQQLVQMKPLMKDFTAEEKDDHYLLIFKSDDETLDDSLMEVIQASLPDEMQMMGDIFENATFNSLNYEMKIDKDNYYVQALNMTMDMDMKMEEQDINLNQDMKMTYSNYNGVDEIVVPDDVIENAEEIEM